IAAALLPFFALAVGSVYGQCDCAFGEVPGSTTKVCLGGNSVVTCLAGKINVTVGNVKYAFDRATCLDNTWYGSTCAGAVFMLSAPNPFFNCYDTVVPTTVPTTTGPTTVPTTTVPPPPPCTCAYENAGATMNLPAPVSSCTNGVNQVVQCDDKIYSKIGNGDLVEYDRVSCSAGKWYGTSCDGTISSIGVDAVKVQCGTTAEPPLCAPLPFRGGLKYVGTVDGLQRYACSNDLVVKVKFPGGDSETTAHGKYFECNSTFSRTVSSGGSDSLPNGPGISDVSCRDYGTFNAACSVPYTHNTWRQDGKIECEKGFYPYRLSFVNGSSLQELYWNTADLSSATCGLDGWSIVGTPFSSVKLTGFWCWDAPTSQTGSCGALDEPDRNLNYNRKTGIYSCRTPEREVLVVTTPANAVYYGNKLECVSGQWQFTGTSTVTIAAGSKAACLPLLSNVIPPTTYSLIYAGMTDDGLTRWTCGSDLSLEIDVEFFPETGKHMPIHAKYIVANNSYYRIASSNTDFYTTPGKPILSVACKDLGAVFGACSTPWDIGGIRTGNNYQCMKGWFLNDIMYVDDSGEEKVVRGSSYDMKSIRCQKDGWQPQGTPFSGLRVTAVECFDANPFTADEECPGTITFAVYALNVDKFRKYSTCYEGETLGYTLNSQTVNGAGKKLFCGTNASSGAREWQWSKMDDTDASAIPAGAQMNCF
ncbi:hypothetical protein PFISCL1PPCAC_13739, partial [Pristionchus fissidentatus]